MYDISIRKNSYTNFKFHHSVLTSCTYTKVNTLNIYITQEIVLFPNNNVVDVIIIKCHTKNCTNSNNNVVGVIIIKYHAKNY